MKVFYFGCPKGEKGHYWNFADKPWVHRLVLDPIGAIDGVYAPRVGIDRRVHPDLRDGRPKALEGQAALVHTKGWTVLAYWDCSQDGRPGSNSAFAAEGEYPFGELLAVAKEKWPWVFERQAFEVTEYCDV